MRLPQIILTTIPLVPATLLAAGVLAGGGWAWAGLLYMTLLAPMADRIITDSRAKGGKALPYVVAMVHFILLPTIVTGLSGSSAPLIDKAVVLFAAGLWFGQVSMAAAHELIHRPGRTARRLGMWVYIGLLFGHHTSAHLLVHHRHMGTNADPNSARRGEGLYRFIARAWTGSFRRGYLAEKARKDRLRNPYLLYVGGAVAMLAITGLAAGPVAVALYIALCLHAQMQILMADYVQHYGLRRALTTTGKPVPPGPQHSWNSPHWFSSAMMLNATRHSDHHMRPARAYGELDMPADAPLLPHPLPVMAGIALIPPLWRRIMDPRLKGLSDA